MNQPFNDCLALNFDILLICFNGIIHVAMRMLFKATCLLLEIGVLLCFVTACPNSKVAYHVALMQVLPAFSLPRISRSLCTSATSLTYLFLKA